MRFFNCVLTALLSGTIFASAFAAEATPAKPAAAKKAVRKKAKPTLEQDIAAASTPARSVPGALAKRFAAKKAYAEKHGKEVKILMLGDSITHYWDGRGAKAMRAKYLEPYKYFNLGFAGDRTRNTLYIIEKSGILDMLKPQLVTIMIGTNNSGRYDYRATVAAIKKILDTVSGRYPDAVILLYSIFPRGKDATDLKRIENQKVNAEIAKFCDGKKIIWVDIFKDFLTPEGTLEKSVMYDWLHPSAKGYDIWGKSLQPYFEKYGK
jgi:beta-glucosidase